MKRRSVENQPDLTSHSENSTERLDSLEDMIPRDEAKEELDEEDIEDILVDAYYLLGLVVDLRMKPLVKSDIIRLRKRIEEGLCWYKRN